jgi:HSP20 family protein
LHIAVVGADPEDLRIERRFGTFNRSFTLPQTVDAEAIQARYENGVLTLSIGKKAEAKPKQIKVEIGSSAAAKQVEAGKG